MHKYSLGTNQRRCAKRGIIGNGDLIFSHLTAFAKYVGRLDLVLQDDLEAHVGKKVVSHKFQIFPVDHRLAPGRV